MAGEHFGRAVAVSGDIAVIGVDDSDFGAAYVFARNGTSWAQQAELLPDAINGLWSPTFGQVVAVSGDTVVSGAFQDDDLGSLSGSAYVFEPTVDSDGDGVPDSQGAFPNDPGEWDDFAFQFIETLERSGVTGGCGGGNYCPGDPVTRGQMAVFLVRTFEL